MLKSTFEWAERQDVACLMEFLFRQDVQRPLVCIGSGGSFSACRYAAQLRALRDGGWTIISNLLTAC